MKSRRKAPRIVACPTCAASVEWTQEQRWRPFCSERCQLIDLGGWIDGRNRIPGDETTPAPTDGDYQDPPG